MTEPTIIHFGSPAGSTYDPPQEPEADTTGEES